MWKRSAKPEMWKQTETLGLRQEAICLTLDVLGLIKQDETPRTAFYPPAQHYQGFSFIDTDEIRWNR